MNKQVALSQVSNVSSRSVLLLGPLTHGKVNTLIAKMIRFEQEGNQPIELIINSHGGSLKDAQTLSQAIEYHLSVPIHAKVIGSCSSVALLVLLSCPVRTCVKRATFHVHAGITSRVQLKKGILCRKYQQLILNECYTIEGELVHACTHKLSMTRDDALSLIARGELEVPEVLHAQVAKRYGFVTRIEYEPKNSVKIPI